ncbi:MAG: 30S ribosomal protein S27ae [Candidatus Helarchaeota archaeon]
MSKGVGRYYKISEDGQTLKRLNKFCPRCGPGTFMAEMYDRIVCGHCGFTEFKKKPVKKTKEGSKEDSKKPKAKETKPKTKRKKR